MIRLINVSQGAVAEDYIKRDIPVIVTDGTIGWSAANLFSIPFLYQVSFSRYHQQYLFYYYFRVSWGSTIRPELFPGGESDKLLVFNVLQITLEMDNCLVALSVLVQYQLHSARHYNLVRMGKVTRLIARTFSASGPAVWNALHGALWDPMILLKGFWMMLKSHIFYFCHFGSSCLGAFAVHLVAFFALYLLIYNDNNNNNI